MSVLESVLAERLGLPRAALRERRKAELEEGVDWCVGKSGIEYSADGEAKVLAALDRGAADGAALGEIKQEELSAAGGAEVKGVVIKRLWRLNERRMEGEVDGRRVLIAVKSTAFFMPGMVVQCLVRPDDALAHYRDRYPRRKGVL